MNLADALAVLRSLAPEHLSEDWDRVGLQVGDPSWPLRRAFLCIDLTEQVMTEAIDRKADLIVAYHPPIFSPLPALTSTDGKQRIVLAAAQRKMAIYSPHTALDVADEGINDWLCNGLGNGTVRALRPTRPGSKLVYKLVTFVSEAHVDPLRAALASAGAGQIGHYSSCSFTSVGEGTFLGDESTRPTVGQRGRLERVAEMRLEMVCGGDQLSDVISVLRAAHPYEEPAYDLYHLEPTAQDPCVGQGRLVALDKPATVIGLIRRLKKHLGLQQLQVAVPPNMDTITRVGVCAGAGGSLLDHKVPLDAFFTGEMRHHDILAAQALGVLVILAGHSQTERPYLPVYRDRIIQHLGDKVAWTISALDCPPCVKM